MSASLFLIMLACSGTPTEATPTEEPAAAPAPAPSEPSGSASVTFAPEGAHRPSSSTDDTIGTWFPEEGSAQKAHEGYDGPMGDQEEASLILAEHGGALHVMALGDGGPDGPLMLTLELERTLSTCRGALFADVDGDGQYEAIVMADYMSGAGPQGAVPAPSNAVLDLKGEQLTRLADVEQKIGALATEKEIRAALAAP